MKSIIQKLLGNQRYDEYNIAYKFLGSCSNLLDVGCGSGTFLEYKDINGEGIDLNKDNVDYCLNKGIKASLGDARNIPYAEGTFDGVHFSHVLQLLSPEDAHKAIFELIRVTKSGGYIVITTQNSFKRFYRHPENVRPYPPDALRSLFSGINGSTSPMFSKLGQVKKKYIWLRRVPLIEFYSTINHKLDRIAGIINRIQYKIYRERRYKRFKK